MLALCCEESAEAPWHHSKKKTTHYQEQSYDKVAAYKYEIMDIMPENIAYVDETGIDSYLYREHGYAPRGQQVHARIRGRKYARTGIVAAMLGGKAIAPSKYSGTMNHVLFEDWFQNVLFPELPAGTVIVMDNASFHRKDVLYAMAQEHGFTLIFLPPYSPELNPIEHFWANMKRCVRKILHLLNSLDGALLAVFYLGDKLKHI